MASILKRTILLPIPAVLGDRPGIFLTRWLSSGLEKELCGEATDKFLELLLRGMDFAFCLCRQYRKNILNFRGRYLFRSADHLVQVAAVFENGNMQVLDREIKDPDASVTFRDAGALRAFLLSRDQDILDSLLDNSVEVDGNLNYIYKFGYMANELRHRLAPGL